MEVEMNKPIEKPIRTYDGFEEILDNVRTIIRMHAPENSVLKLIREINRFEDVIVETLNGRYEQAEEHQKQLDLKTPKE